MMPTSPVANITVTPEGTVLLTWSETAESVPVLSIQMDPATARELGEALFKAGSQAPPPQVIE